MMKKIFLSLLFLFSVKVFAQSDSSFKTENIFYISYLNFDKEITKSDGIRITDIDSISLSFEEIVFGQNSNQNKYVKKKIIFDKIDKFGYNVGPSFGARIGIGAGIGFVTGAIIGAFGTSSITGDGSVPAGTYSPIVGLILTVPGALIGGLTGIGAKEYENLDISKYNRAKKFEIIKRLIKNGIKAND